MAEHPDIRAMRICYRLLSRMDRTSQEASLKWLTDRLQWDHGRAKVGSRSTDMRELRKAIGEAGLALFTMLRATGGSVARRTVEFRGPINADVLVQVRQAGDVN